MRHTTVCCLFFLASCGDNQTFVPRDLAPYEPGPTTPLTCLPDLDGVIDADELSATIGVEASYIVSPPLPIEATSGRSIDVVGTVNSDGKRVWDWSVIAEDDMVGTLTGEELSDQWYVDYFPGDEFGAPEFAAPVDLAGRIHAIYSHAENALRLHGTASAEENPPEGKTLLVYKNADGEAAPIAFFPFPLAVGKSWTQTGMVRDGWLQGLHPWAQNDTYEVEVDAAGELQLPDFTFTQVLRVSTKVSIQPLAGSSVPYVQRQVSFLFECFTEVARASSLFIFDPADDPGKDFTEAHEIRKLGWF